MRVVFEKKLRGTYLSKNKHLTEKKEIEQATIPKLLIFPMTMHIGNSANPIVSVGDKVKIGSLIGEKVGLLSAVIHSSVSGQVKAIEERQVGDKLTTCVIVENDFEESICSDFGMELKKQNKASFLELIADAGIVGMGGATFPTDIKLTEGPGKKLKHFIINAAECEPFVTSDRRIIIERITNLLTGIGLIDNFIGFETITIAIEENSIDAIQSIRAELERQTKIKLKVVPNFYPQGAEKVITKSVLGTEIPIGKLPIDIHALILNVSTIVAIYQAYYKKSPLIERVTTISGDVIKEPKNLIVRIGTPVGSVIKDCGDFCETPEKLLNGGPMMGKVIASLAEPITKGTSLILALSKKEVSTTQSTNCIKCSECIKGCPIHLQPILIHKAFEKGDIKLAEKLGALNCIECGNCTYSCPSKIDIVSSIKQAKNEILKRRSLVK